MFDSLSVVLFFYRVGLDCEIMLRLEGVLCSIGTFWAWTGLDRGFDGFNCD